jgi:hypothetical protein
MEKINSIKEKLLQYFDGFSKASADTIAWLSVICIMASTIPGFLAVMAHATDRMPSLDITLMVWGGLLLYFLRSAILKDMLMLVTIGLGFAVQAILLGLIFFV